MKLKFVKKNFCLLMENKLNAIKQQRKCYLSLIRDTVPPALTKPRNKTKARAKSRNWLKR